MLLSAPNQECIPRRVSLARAALTLLALTGCAGEATATAELEATQGEQAALRAVRADLIDRAYQGAGGLDALLSLESLEYRSHGFRRMLGEGFAAGSDAIDVAVFEARVRADLNLEASQTEWALETEYPLPFSHAYAEIVTAQGGYIEGPDNIFGIPSRAMPSDRWAAAERQQQLLHPHLLLRELAQGGRRILAAAVQRRKPGFELVLEDDVAPLHLRFDGAGQLVELTSVESDPLLRDVPIRVQYSEYQSIASVAFPTEVALFVGGQEIHHEARSELQANLPLDEALFQLPEPAPPLDQALAARGRAMHQWHEEFASAGVPLDSLQDQVNADEIAPGVFHLTGGTHHSLAVVQERGIVLAEAPLYPERSEAIRAFLRARFPQLAVTHVISSHHHTDHSAGLRTFVALGTEILLGRDSADFFRSEVFRAASRIIPDRLAERSARPRLRTVPSLGNVTLADAERPLVVQHVRSSHASDMLITYLPRQKLLFVSDLYSPQGPFNPVWAGELRTALRELGLDVAFIAGAHGAGLGTVEDLDRALASQVP